MTGVISHETQLSLEQRLVSYLSTRLPEAKDISVSELTQATAGFSYETYLFQASWHQGGMTRSQGYAVRIQPLWGPVPPYDVEPQFRILQVLYRTEVPVPRVFWLEKDPSILGAPFFVMEKVEGETPLPWKSAHTSYNDPAQRELMAHQVVRVLSALHTIDWKALGIDFFKPPASATEYATREIKRWETVQKENEYLAEPILAEAYGWLKANIPIAPCTTIVHGDFRLGNFIWRDNRIAAFLDWEMAALGDPLSDVGWMCVKVFQGHTGKVSGLLSREEFLSSYEKLTGLHPKPESVLWWEVFGYAKLVAVFSAGLRAYVDGRRDDARLANFEFDILSHLNLLAQTLGF
ncbi:MAG: phosphotransferase family protein [Chloroflexi bacterium]|nr:phosphotransferase family protein [Chloroflexota bacterium]